VAGGARAPAHTCCRRRTRSHTRSAHARATQPRRARRATPLDIFNFFEGYEIIAESLQLGVDALGRPSGEAWLTFGGSEEALRAVRERNRHYLGNRYLELSLT
jgi:hypothetical protein